MPARGVNRGMYILTSTSQWRLVVVWRLCVSVALRTVLLRLCATVLRRCEVSLDLCKPVVLSLRVLVATLGEALRDVADGSDEAGAGRYWDAGVFRHMISGTGLAFLT